MFLNLHFLFNILWYFVLYSESLHIHTGKMEANQSKERAVCSTPDLGMRVCHQGIPEAETGGSGVRGQPMMCSEFKTVLDLGLVCF